MGLFKRERQPDGVLFDAAKIDLVAMASDQTTVELIIVQDSLWSGSEAQIHSLQEKIHTYVGFAHDGQMASAYPETAGRAWRIVIVEADGLIDGRTAAVLDRAAEKVREYGGDLLVRSRA